MLTDEELRELKKKIFADDLGEMDSDDLIRALEDLITTIEAKLDVVF